METRKETDAERTMLRITSFGTLSIAGPESQDEHTGTINSIPRSLDKAQGRGTVSALTLLKILLCQPSRFASRDFLMETLWPDHPRGKAQARLDDAASLLRTLLRSMSGRSENLLPSVHSSKESGNGYRLAPYPLVWVDADAFLWNTEQAARMERFGDDPLPYWEQACALASRGAFVADEPYSEWTHKRRELLAGHYRQCVLRLAALYCERGGSTQAEQVLRAYVVSHRDDEDALRPLMELLGEQERYQETEESYQHLCRELEQEGRKPDHRTQDIREYYRAKHIHRERSERLPSTHPVPLAGSNSLQITSSSSIAEHDIVTRNIAQAEEVHKLEEKDMNRRSLLHSMFSTALLTPLLGEIQLPGVMNTIAIEAYYPRWVTIMETFWQLYFTGGIPVIEMCLPNLLSELNAATCQSSRLQKKVMALASQAYQMHWLLALQRQDFGQALLAIDQAYTYGKEAQDANLELASLVRKAHVYFHMKNPVKQLSVHEQAAQYVDSVNPLMRGWYYLLVAENHASLRHGKDATNFLDLAHEMLSNNSTQDGTLSYVQMNAYLIANFEIICQLHLNQPQKALDTLKHLGLSATDPRCSELSNHRLTALYLLDEMDELCHQFAPTVQVALQTKSHLRYHELCSLYCKMVARWPEEQKVRELEALLHL